MARILIGTQSFASDILKKAFFVPAGIRPKDFLWFISVALSDSVEIDGTFYSMPTERQVMSWYQSTAADFKISLKLWRGITHEDRLKNSGDTTREFLNVVGLLQEKLGCVVIQFPGDFTSNYFDTLDTYLGTLPSEMRFAVEIRHDSWMTPRFYDMLQSRGVGLVLSDSWRIDHGGRLTANFCYIRLNANDERLSGTDDEKIRIIQDRDRGIVASRAKLMVKLQSEGIDSYCYPNDCVQGNAAATVRSLRKKTGLPLLQAPGRLL